MTVSDFHGIIGFVAKTSKAIQPYLGVLLSLATVYHLIRRDSASFIYFALIKFFN